MHKTLTALHYAESWVVNHREDFQCPAAIHVSHDISEVLFLYMHQKKKHLFFPRSLPQYLTTALMLPLNAAAHSYSYSFTSYRYYNFQS